MTPLAGQKFAQGLMQARIVLENSRTLAGSDPMWTQVMAQVAIGQGWPVKVYENLIFASVRSFPGYYQLYFDATEFYFPQWYGQQGDLDRFAQAVSDASDGAQEGESYARIYWYLIAQRQNFTARGLDINWSRLDSSMKAIIHRHPDPRNLEALTMLSCFVNDPDVGRTAVHLLNEMKETDWSQVWPNRKVRSECRKAFS